MFNLHIATLGPNFCALFGTLDELQMFARTDGAYHLHISHFERYSTILKQCDQIGEFIGLWATFQSL